MPRIVGGIGALAVVALIGCLVMFNAWSGNAQQPNTTKPADKPADKPGEFAADREGDKPVPFDGKRAMGYLADVCKIGPRISGTEGMTKQQELIQKHFEKLGAKVTHQKFTARQKSTRKDVEMANMVVSFFPDRKRRVILCSHYDTRPIADQEENRRKWNDPFVSANDGGSGVALLMELGNHMKDLKTQVGVDFVFFDGEEYIFEPQKDEYFFGSKHFGDEYKKARQKDRDSTVYLAAVLLDMVGGKDAKFPVEPNSAWLAGALVKDLWAVAKQQGCTAFKEENGTPVEDDHLALNRAGIPAVDIIDFEYTHWHKLTDVPENCSADSLTQVATVLSVWLQAKQLK